jgi:rhodanese-related sulfurtransferase
MLLEKGFQKVTPIQGGFDAWKSNGFPIEP